MISAQDFLFGCIGAAILLVGLAYSIKILSGIRTKALIKNDVHRSTIARIEEPDPMELRLQELRSTRFGRSMDPKLALRPLTQTPAFKRKQKT